LLAHTHGYYSLISWSWNSSNIVVLKRLC